MQSLGALGSFWRGGAIIGKQTHPQYIHCQWIVKPFFNKDRLGVKREGHQQGALPPEPAQGAVQERQLKHRDAGVASEIYMRTREKLMG